MDGQKIPLAKSLNEFTNKKISNAYQLLGKSLPCTVISNDNSIVTVSFDIQSEFTLPQVTMPLFGPEYVRYPIKAGDKGVAVAMSVSLGGNSGLGSGNASLIQPFNLEALVFLPFANTAWSSVDPDSVTVYGPNGVVLRDIDSASTFVLTPDAITIISSGTITIQSGTAVFTLDNGTFTLTGQTGTITGSSGLTMSDGTHYTSPTIMNSAWDALVTWLNTHIHSTPSGNSGVPITPFSGGNIAP